MASCRDWIAFREAVLSANLINRTRFLSVVRYSRVCNVEGLPDTDATRAFLACQAPRLLPPRRSCAHCMAPYKLFCKSRRYTWCGPQYQDACHECVHKQYNVSAIGSLANVKQNMWMANLDCFTMWCFQYPHLQLLRELHPTNHESADA